MYNTGHESLSQYFLCLALEDTKTSLDVERSRLQAHVRDLERQQMQTSHQLQSAQEELQRSHAANTQSQNEEKELQTRLATEIEERERAQQELHQLKKQVYSQYYSSKM